MGILSRFIYIYKQRLRISLEGIVCSVQWVGERGGESSSQILAQPCAHNCTNDSFQQCNYLQSCEVRPASPNTQNPFLLPDQTSRTAKRRRDTSWAPGVIGVTATEQKRCGAPTLYGPNDRSITASPVPQLSGSDRLPRLDYKNHAEKRSLLL